MSRPSSASSNGSQSRTSSASSDDSFFSVADGLEQLELDTSDIFDDNVYAEALLKVEIPKNANEYYSIVKKEIESSPSPPPPSSQPRPPPIGVFPGLTKPPSDAQKDAALKLIRSIEEFIKWSTDNKKDDSLFKTYLHDVLMSTRMMKELARQDITAFIQIWQKNSNDPNVLKWFTTFKLGGRRRSKMTRKSKSKSYRIKTTKGKRRTNRKMRRKSTTLRKNK